MHKGTILAYLKEYGNRSFEEYPFHDVDSLILSQFAYLKFDGIVPDLQRGGRSISMSQMKHHPSFLDLFADERYRKDNMALFDAMFESRRFLHTRFNYYVNIIEEEKETQFSAITMVLDDGTVYVAFRGTDETLVGWKEDFNMFVEDSVPGQRMSTDYLNTVAKKVRCPFYVGGHSKGGNLAVYASVFCLPEVQDKIIKIYDHDGPGMRPETKQTENYKCMRPKMDKSVPRSSLVGLMLSFDEHCKIIASKNAGLMQHDPFSWIVIDGEFAEYDKVSNSNRRRGKAINEWAASLTDDERHLVVDSLYEMMLSSGEDNLIDLKHNWKESLTKINESLKETEPEKKKKILKILRHLFDFSIPEILDLSMPLTHEKTLLDFFEKKG